MLFFHAAAWWQRAPHVHQFAMALHYAWLQ
jgi:hypothetical protein